MKRLDESGDNEIEYDEFKNFVIKSIFINGDVDLWVLKLLVELIDTCKNIKD